MTKRQAFLLGLAVSLAILLPFYFTVAAFSLTRAKPAENAQSGVPIVQPTTDDRKTILLMTGEETPETFVLARFDALENQISCVEVPGQTVVLCSGTPRSLREACRSAGPAQAAAALKETLKIPVDNYLYCGAEQMAQLGEGLGNAQLRLVNYISSEALAQLQLDIPGVRSLTLTTQMLCQALQAPAKSEASQHLLRAQGYLAFLRSGEQQLGNVLPQAMRTAVSQYSTNLTAAEIYDYERILQFLQKNEPQFVGCVLPGSYQEDRYELDSGAMAVAREYLSSAAQEIGSAEDEDQVTTPEQAAASAAQGSPRPESASSSSALSRAESGVSVQEPGELQTEDRSSQDGSDSGTEELPGDEADPPAGEESGEEKTAEERGSGEDSVASSMTEGSGESAQESDEDGSRTQAAA